MEVDSCFEMFPVSETVSHLFDGLDFGVQPFCYCIGDGMSKIGEHVVKMSAQHPRCLDHRLQSGVRCPKIPFLKMMNRPSSPSIMPKVSKTLLDRPRSGGL